MVRACRLPVGTFLRPQCFLLSGADTASDEGRSWTAVPGGRRSGTCRRASVSTWVLTALTAAVKSSSAVARCALAAWA